jgi:hypothetical protein
MKPFTSVIYEFSLSAGVFVPDRPFLLKLMFVSKAEATPSGAFFRWSPPE